MGKENSTQGQNGYHICDNSVRIMSHVPLQTGDAGSETSLRFFSCHPNEATACSLPHLQCTLHFVSSFFQLGGTSSGERPLQPLHFSRAHLLSGTTGTIPPTRTRAQSKIFKEELMPLHVLVSLFPRLQLEAWSPCPFAQYLPTTIEAATPPDRLPPDLVPHLFQSVFNIYLPSRTVLSVHSISQSPDRTF